MNRRGFLGGFIAALATPAIIRTPALLMPVRVPIVLATERMSYNLTSANGVFDIGQELAAVTRRAIVPKIFIQVYEEHPLLQALTLERYHGQAT